jgi:bacteriorhodopsin
MACVSFLWIVYTLLITGTRAARTKTAASVTKFYSMIAGYTVIVWIAYPIIWAIGNRRILSVDGEIIAYAVLDLLAKVGFGAWLLWTHKKLPEAQNDIGGFWAHGFAREGTIRIGNGNGEEA